MDPGFLEHPAVQHGHGPAACLRCGTGLPLPCTALNPSRRYGRARELILQPLEAGAQFIAQLFEPFSRLRLLLIECGVHWVGNSPVCRKASPKTMAQATATLSERMSARIGMVRRSVTRPCTS